MLITVFFHKGNGWRLAYVGAPTPDIDSMFNNISNSLRLLQ